MTPDDEWQTEMTARYPLTLGNVSLGFDGIGPGWRGIVERLCAKLEPYIAAAVPDERQSLSAVQVKEKFGGLRFYTGTVTEETSIWIDEAEAESCRTCDRCGGAGEQRRTAGGHIFTRCEAHAA
jgi:hypothetical protein